MIQKISRNIQQPLRIFHKPSRQSHPSGHAKMMCVRALLIASRRGCCIGRMCRICFPMSKADVPLFSYLAGANFTHIAPNDLLSDTIAVPTFQWRPNDIAPHSIVDDVQTDVFCHSTRNFFIFSKVAPMASGGTNNDSRDPSFSVACESSCSVVYPTAKQTIGLTFVAKITVFFDTCLLRGTERYAQNALVACCRWKWTQDFVPLKYNLTTKLWLASRFGTLRTMLWLVDAIGGSTSGVRTCPHHCSGSIQIQFHTGKTIIRPLENYKWLKIRTLNHKHPNMVRELVCNEVFMQKVKQNTIGNWVFMFFKNIMCKYREMFLTQQLLP